MIMKCFRFTLLALIPLLFGLVAPTSGSAAPTRDVPAAATRVVVASHAMAAVPLQGMEVCPTTAAGPPLTACQLSIPYVVPQFQTLYVTPNSMPVTPNTWTVCLDPQGNACTTFDDTLLGRTFAVGSAGIGGITVTTLYVSSTTADSIGLIFTVTVGP